MEVTKEPPSWRREIVVLSCEVEHYNRLGYVVTGVFDEQVSGYISLTDQVCPAGQSYPVQVSRQEAAVTKVLKFHMTKDGDSHVAQLEEEIASLKMKHEDAQSALGAAQEAATQLRATSEQLARDMERRRVELEKQNSDAAELRRRLQKMEGDIAKIRGAIGDLKMKEILGG